MQHLIWCVWSLGKLDIYILLHMDLGSMWGGFWQGASYSYTLGPGMIILYQGRSRSSAECAVWGGGTWVVRGRTGAPASSARSVRSSLAINGVTSVSEQEALTPVFLFFNFKLSYG